MPHRDSDTVKLALLRLNSMPDMSWGEISREIGIPPATLWDIADGKPVPRKWRRRLGLCGSRDLYAMPVKELRWAIKNREEM